MLATEFIVHARKDIAYGPHGERNLLDAYLPSDSPTPRPGIVCIHGGGWEEGDKSGLGWVAESFARRGFAAFSISYRYSSAGRFPVPFLDAQRAVRWLRARAAAFGLDPARLGAIGDSAGGHLAACLALMELPENDPALAGYSSRVQCVVDVYGPVDMIGMMNSASAPIIERLIGQPLPGTEALYRAASPARHVRPGAPPFLIIHGALDDGRNCGSVPLSQSENLQRALQAAGADAELLVLDGAGHGFLGDPINPFANQTAAAAIKFFEEHL